MREKRTHAVAWVAVFILVLVASAGCSWAQNGLVWPGYHNDGTHKGQNVNSSDLGSMANPDPKKAGLNLIWAWPRAKQPPKGDDAGVVDDLDGAERFLSQGIWVQETLPNAIDAWKDHFLRATVVSRDKAQKINPGKVSYAKSEAVWFFPSASMPYGNYQIWVWVPPAPKNSGVDNTRLLFSDYPCPLIVPHETKQTIAQLYHESRGILLCEDYCYKDIRYIIPKGSGSCVGVWGSSQIPRVSRFACDM